MTTILITLLLQSMLMPPRVSLENPAVVSSVPPKLKKDYDKAWDKFVAGKSDPNLAKDLEKLLKKQKDFDAALTIRAYLDLYAARTAEAEQKFETVFARDSNNRIALFYLAELAYLRSDYVRAGELYDKLIESGVRRPELETKRQKALLLAAENLLRSAGRAEAEGRFGQAEALYRNALHIAPQEPEFHARLAQSLAKQQKWDDALNHYRLQSEYGGARAETDKYIAEALMNLGRTEEARDVLARLRDSGSGDEILESKVRELEDLGRWGNEIDHFREIESSESITREQLSAILIRYFPQITEFPQSPQIVTDILDSWARTEIQTIVGVGLIDRFPNHTFKPELHITRGGFALSLARLMRILRVSPVETTTIMPSDVASTNAILQDVQFVLSHGLMFLDDTGSFRINGSVSGEEAVGTAERVLELVRVK